jgi:hypothetical protein
LRLRLSAGGALSGLCAPQLDGAIIHQHLFTHAAICRRQRGHALCALADEQGRFSFKVYEGVKYYARVVIEKEKDEYYHWVEVPPWEGLKQFRLVADERME